MKDQGVKQVSFKVQGITFGPYSVAGLLKDKHRANGRMYLLHTGVRTAFQKWGSQKIVLEDYRNTQPLQAEAQGC